VVIGGRLDDRRSGGVGVDPKLVEIAKAAELGQPLPLLKLATASHIYYGAPGPSPSFADASDQPLRDDLWNLAGRTAPRKEREAVYEEAVNRIGPAWRRVVSVPEEETPTSLTLFDTIMWAWGEPSGLRVNAIRVNLAAISAWWVGAGQEVRGRGSGGWLFGIAVPIGDGG
jgi:hypothetical protein